jgi:hypothetical protein
MASPSRLMALGMANSLALEIGQDSASANLTATGSNAATALSLTADFNIFGTVAASTGAMLPAAEGQPDQVIYNGGANALSVYPQTGEIINGLSAGAAFSVGAGKAAIFVPGKNNSGSPAVGGWIALVSA